MQMPTILAVNLNDAQVEELVSKGISVIPCPDASAAGPFLAYIDVVAASQVGAEHLSIEAHRYLLKHNIPLRIV